MDVSSHSNGSPNSSLVSRFQKNDLLPSEETRSTGRKETGVEPRYRDHDDDLLITPDPSKCASPSEAGHSPVNQSSLYPEQSMVETENDLVQDWAAKEIQPVSEVNPTVTKKTVLFSEVTTGANETGPASELNTPIQPIPSEAEQDTEQVFEGSHSLHDEEAKITSDDEERVTDTETEAEREDGTEDDEDFAAGGNTVNFGDVDSFDLDDLLDDSSDEELPTLQEIYQRCQTIRNRRFYADLYNVWQRKIQEDEREDAIKILSASGFGKSGPDEIGDGLDKALSLVPERFWRNDSSANDISIEDLKMIVEERKDAEERAQYREYCQAAEAGSKSGGQTRMRRSAIATGGGQSSAILHNYLKMNLLKSHVPVYYFPSYLQRFKEATKTDPESESEEENSDND